MGNSHSQSVSRFTPSLLNGHQKEGRGKKLSVAKFASPENRVLPVPTNGSQRLRSTDNGNILQNGGTISGRKVPISTPETEFVQLLQKKCHSLQPTTEKTSFQTMYGHRKSHSDPDIVRMMMNENDNDSEEEESDPEDRGDQEGNFCKRSIIAVSPSKAKIKSRKKKRAPEPPQSNTLPRTLGRSPSHYKEETQRPNSSHSHYDYNDTPRRPLPPIPPEEMPPPPPPPPPDYNRGSDDTRNSRAQSKNYEKNRRTVDKWKFSKQPQENTADKFPRQRCKSLDRCEEQRLRECAENRNERCYRNNSLRRANHVPVGGNAPRNGNETKLNGPALKDAIAEAAKKRCERLERGQECRNSSFKLSMKYPRDISAFKDQGRNETPVVETTPPHSHRTPPPYNHRISPDQQNIRYDKYGQGPERSNADHSNSQNFIRKAPIYKRTSDNWKEYRNECPTRSYERQVQTELKSHNDSEIIYPDPNNRLSKWDSIIQEPIPTMLPEGAVSVSSASEEEMEIDLQLRPTLPRRPVELSRFSPTDVWKSINLDFFKSHQQRSDVSSDDADDIMEEKICRINRPVAPRRLIQDRSGDSGISPDAGSPMLLNESYDALVMNNNVMCNTPSAPLLVEETSALWIPQHDLADDSECGTDDSPLENRNNSSNTHKISAQAKFSMPNLMFPSRSLPRTDQRNGIDEQIVADKEKTRSKGRRKKSYKNAEGQHFNSLRNLKKALGLRLKAPVDESKGLDPNWSLSRSLPNFINNLNVENNAKIENESPELYILDHIRRSNSESKAVHQERMRNKLTAAHSSNNINTEWRKSFPYQSTEGHVIYLPEYRTNTTPPKPKIPAVEDIHVNTDSELVLKKPSGRKKFSYQSTVRQEEKKKLEEKLAREAEARERKRQQEIEWMNKVEEEFRKQRDKEKINIRHQLRILNLQEKSQSNETGYNKSPKHEITEFADNLPKIKPNVQYGGFPEPGDGKVQSFRNGQDIMEESNKWQQPTGMKKWLKRQSRDYQGLSPTRPEPEGGRSSSDDCKQMDGKNHDSTERSTAHNNYYKSGRPKCIHGNEAHCSLCNNNFVSKAYELSRKESQKVSPSNDAKLSSIPKSMVSKTVESHKCIRDQLHSNKQNTHDNGIKQNGTTSDLNETNFPEDSMEEYELHTKLCRTNSGRTFESHSYYALERRKEDSPDCDPVRKMDSEKGSSANLFSTSHFQKELKENVRKKARDFEKRTRKYQSCDYDSDDSGSDVREMRHQRPQNGRNQRKKSSGESREPSFSRNHPHRNAARVKSQTNGHIPNGRLPSYPKSPNNRAIMTQQRIPTC
ncbi:hypothetical protein AVEN_84965-1 [Araneus ventricosus]|uniref:Uncharacterized protein n=1 Tax=Araneus ventricosus TaxID=182803 RepID=A0A4Y2C0I6_ARAVE|nr:hypothetical protein AVEN_84965-1 [Araneus ventricosus]